MIKAREKASGVVTHQGNASQVHRHHHTASSARRREEPPHQVLVRMGSRRQAHPDSDNSAAIRENGWEACYYLRHRFPFDAEIYPREVSTFGNKAQLSTKQVFAD